MGGKGDKREQIRQAAIRLIAREGFHSTTTDRIAAEAGVAVGTIYNYFQNKEDILKYIFQVEYEKRKAYFTGLQGRDIHPLEKLKAVLEMHFSEVEQNPDLVRVIIEERKLSRRYYFLDQGDCKGLQTFLEEILQEGISQGRVRSCEPQLVATVLFGAIEAVMAQYLLELERGGGSGLLTGAVQEITALLWQGLASD